MDLGILKITDYELECYVVRRVTGGPCWDRTNDLLIKSTPFSVSKKRQKVLSN